MANEAKLSHYDEAGRARMVDVSNKMETRREAEAHGVRGHAAGGAACAAAEPQGNPLEVARIAGIMAAKRTAELIPMCHSLPLSFVDVISEVGEHGVEVRAIAATTAGTGVEMEAMVAASVAALTIYDMCKALDKGIEIREVVLLRKSGGKSGDYVRGERRSHGT